MSRGAKSNRKYLKMLGEKVFLLIAQKYMILGSYVCIIDQIHINSMDA